uniref:TonB-dependent receptor n=1 Tax=uncultured Draconibacterium sp. TaxID=1573823 RepID=UPI0032177AB7
MKKVLDDPLLRGLKPYLLFMRVTVFFILLGITQLSASVYSQNTKLSVKMKKASIDELLNYIEDNTEFSFLYRSDLFEDEGRIEVNLENRTIDVILDQYIVSKGYTYEIVDKTIIIREKERDEQEPEQQLEQIQDNKVTGKVTDEQGKPIPGVTITIVGTTRGVITDNDGTYTIEASPEDKLVFSFIGMESQLVDVKGQTKINVMLKVKSEELDDVTVVAYAKQKKESVLASIETVKPEELRIPASNLTTALAGRMSGIISYQRSGEPGQDNAQFFIRGVTTFGYKKDPLILIDGIELSASDLSRMHPDDIAAFSIMKDATATALYGARGANGVILVTTKEGREGKAKVSARFETSMSQATKDVELADPLTYMNLHNEAVRTRDPLGFLPYSPERVDNTINGTNPYVYPQTDWQSALLKDHTINKRLNFNISGGGKIARYYLSGGVTQDNGILKVDKQNDFNSNIDLKRYRMRSNININLTKTTEAVVRMNGTFDDYRGPIHGGSRMYQMIMRTNPVLFPAYYKPDENNKYTNHILFGNYGNGNYLNPYAEMVKGYKEYSRSLMLAQFELKQNLDFVTDGLKARILGNTTRNAYFDVTRNYNPYYYGIEQYDNRKNVYELEILNADSGTDYLNYNEGGKYVSSSFYAEAALDYAKTFKEKHSVSGLLVGIIRQQLSGNAGELQKSLPYRNLGLSGRFTYSFDTRYFLEFNFGYNGTERFAKKERFGFFPSAGFGWYASKEKFWEPLKNTITKLKFKATHGLVGNDAIGSSDHRFFYLSNVNMDDGGKGYVWGTSGSNAWNGISISRYANDMITWETATKTNLGMEVSFFDKIDIDVDIFKEYRSNILFQRLAFSTFGLQSPTMANVGEASSKGIDLSIDIQHNFTDDLWITARGNFTYAKSKHEKVEEPDYSATPWMSAVGQPIGQQWGFIAERLFVDDNDVDNSPVQELGSIVRGGDIKYKDINGDDKITNLDKVPIGFPTTPEIIYGIGSSVGYKNLDFSFFFQGSARSSFWVDPSSTAPFVDNENDFIANNALMKAYADNHWSEANRDIYALWPRLSDQHEENNEVLSTWFMHNGAFLRLKSVEMGFTIPVRLYNRFGVEHIRFYASGTNLLTISNFKLWDPEMGGNGLGYPVQRVFNLGLQVSF